MIRSCFSLLTLLTPAVALAHSGTMTYGDIRLGEREVAWELKIGASELAEPLGLEPSTVLTRDQSWAGAPRSSTTSPGASRC